MKRFISMLLVVLMILSVIPVSVSTETKMLFKDVKKSQRFYEAVKYTADFDFLCYYNGPIPMILTIG